MLRLAYTLAVGTWFGAIVALTFVITPTAHGTMSPSDARRLLRPLFPRLYWLGTGCGFAALGTVALGGTSVSPSEALRLTLPVAVALLCTLAAQFGLFPRMRDLARDDPQFGWLHQVSAMLNSTTLGALALAMAGAVMR